ncbi:MAG: phosphate/phosphite/phosphonate ABC transporter substrate-binding protein [Pseudobdellovibrio sp.]
MMKLALKNTYVISLLTVFLLGGVHSFAQTSAASKPSAITLGIIPGGNPESVKKESKYLAEKLQDKLGLPVNIYISKNYAGLTSALKDKKVDYAFLTAFSLVEAEESVALKVLLKKTWVGPFYYSSLVSLKNNSISSVKDFKNKRISFVDEQSTSGYIYPLVYLKKQNLKLEQFSKVKFSGSHAESVAQLEKKESDIIAVFSDNEKGTDGAWTKFGKLKKGAYKVLWVGDAIPNDPFVVRTDFYEKYPMFTHDLMYQMIELQDDLMIRKNMSEVMGAGDLLPATSKQYDPVREVRKVLKD